MEIGDLFTQEQFNDIKAKYKEKTFTPNSYVLDKDLEFEKEVIEGEVHWRLTSTFESRVENQGDHPKIHRKEQRYYKRYYEGKS